MKKQCNVSLLLAAVACMVSVAVMVLALFGSGQAEFSPPPFDASAQAGTPDVLEELGWGELDTQVFRASVRDHIGMDGSSADVWLTNPQTNTVWLKLRVLDTGGRLLGETGLLRPGEYVRSVILDPAPQAGTPGVLKLMASQPETYYSEGSVILNTTISE